MFHWNDNLFFGRCDDGSVRIVQFHGAPFDWPKWDGVFDDAEKWPETVIDVVVPPEQWASIIASVSARGETAQQYAIALAYHNTMGCKENEG